MANSVCTPAKRKIQCRKEKTYIESISLIFALVLLLLPRVILAQDDFPPPGIFIPCCSSGGTGGHTGATYGNNGQSAWRETFGVQPGDIVTIRFQLRARSAGSLHAWPQSTDGASWEYLGDENNPYQKWYWNTGERDSGGTFCIDCNWRFVAQTWNPWIYVQYWDSGDGWDVDLNVINIERPRTFSILPPWSKETYHSIGWFLKGTGAGLGIGAGIAAYWGDAFTALLTGSAGIVVGLIGDRLTAVDPWDDYYGYPYDPSYPSAEQLGLQWMGGGYGDDFWDTLVYDHNLIVGSTINMVGQLDAANVSINRANSCAQIGAGCEEWQAERARQFFEAANYNAYWAAAAMWQAANTYESRLGSNDYSNALNEAASGFWQMYNNSVR